MPTKVDFGPCPACQTNNSFAASRCRQCGAELPWAKGKTSRAAAPPAAPSAPTFVPPAAPPRPLDDGPSKHVSNWDWKAIGVQLFGGAVVVGGAFLWCGNVLGFYRTFPLAGYITMAIGAAIWRAGASLSS